MAEVDARDLATTERAIFTPYGGRTLTIEEKVYVETIVRRSAYEFRPLQDNNLEFCDLLKERLENKLGSHMYMMRSEPEFLSKRCTRRRLMDGHRLRIIECRLAVLEAEEDAPPQLQSEETVEMDTSELKFLKMSFVLHYPYRDLHLGLNIMAEIYQPTPEDIEWEAEQSGAETGHDDAARAATSESVPVEMILDKGGEVVASGPAPAEAAAAAVADVAEATTA